MEINADILNFGKLKQAAETTTALVAPNGNEQGKLESYNIGPLREINVIYSTGQIVKLGPNRFTKI